MNAMSFYVPRLASCAIILLFTLMSATIAHDSLHLDNADFAAASSAVANTGLPIFYRGENDPTELALWHPPLYVYLLGGWFKIFGVGPAQARTFGVLFTIVQGWMVLAMVATLFGPAARSTIEPWFWAIYLLDPYTLQATSMLDIDTTIYGPLLCWVLLATLRLNWRAGDVRQDTPSRWEYVQLIAAIALSLWAKLTTILLVIPFVFLLLLRPLGVWRAARLTVLATVAGVGMFLITYFGYGAVMHLNVKFTFGFLVSSFLTRMTRGSSGNSGLVTRLSDMRKNAQDMIPFMVRWTGLLPWIALAGGVMVAGRSAIRIQSLRAWDYCLLLFLAGATTLYYCGQTTTWGEAPFKYVFVFWGLVLVAPLMFVVKSELWTSHSVQPNVLKLWPTGTPLRLSLVLLLAVSAWYGRYRLQDHPMREWRTAFGVVLPPALLLLPSIGKSLQNRPALGYARVASLLGICIWAGIQFGVALYQLQVPYSKTYNYGQAGMEETAAFLRANLSENDLFSSMKDLGYLTHRRYFDDYAAVNDGSIYTGVLIDALRTGKVKFAVFTEARGQDTLASNRVLDHWIQQHCKLVKSFGNYRIYQLASP
jgi:hypothetical protein